MLPVELTLSLPRWVATRVAALPACAPDLDERMRLVIALAATNVAEKTGGPFAAAVFERDTGLLVSAGVNVVVPSTCSIAHAEMLALAIAQKQLGRFDLGAPGLAAHELVTSTAPCAMCFGAIVWSGVSRLICGARSADAEAIGFEEGPKPDKWLAELEARGIVVTSDVCREEACSVLRNYRESGGEIYNPRPR